MRNDYCVYKHTSPSGKVYIGITRQAPEERWQAGWGYRRNEYFFRAILKYGWDNFTHEVLHFGLSKEEACAAEISLIAAYHCNEKEYGYNLTEGGDHPTLSPEHRKKIGDAQRGRKLSDEQRRRISEVQRGRRPTDETRRRLSDARRGKHLSAETRQKLTNGKRDKMRAVLCVETGDIYPSASEAARRTGYSQGNISMCCLGQRKTAYGFHWIYYNEQGGDPDGSV